MVHHKCICRNRLAYFAVINQFAAGLDSRAHESIRRAANQQIPGVGGFEYPAAFFGRCGQGLFVINILARLNRLHGDFKVGIRAGDVEHGLDFRISQQPLIITGIEIELIRLRVCPLSNQVRAGNNV